MTDTRARGAGPAERAACRRSRSRSFEPGMPSGKAGSLPREPVLLFGVFCVAPRSSCATRATSRSSNGPRCAHPDDPVAAVERGRESDQSSHSACWRLSSSARGRQIAR
jgi:hypothetical protein